MLISEYINPVMYIDPSGESAILLAITIGLILFAAFSTSPEMQDGLAAVLEMGKDGIFVDFNLSLGFLQTGYCFVLNLEESYIEFYPHAGLGFGSPVSFDLGVIDNYEKPGDYKGHFLSASVAFWGGVGHSWTPDFENRDLYLESQARSYFLTAAIPSINFGYSYYFWFDKSPIVIDWSGE